MCGPKRFGEARERCGMHRPWPWKGRARHEETREPRKMPEMDSFLLDLRKHVRISSYVLPRR